MDFFFFKLKAEKMLRPSCVPWELSGPEMNEGTAAMYFIHSRARNTVTLNMHLLFSTTDLCECHAAAEQ